MLVVSAAVHLACSHTNLLATVVFLAGDAKRICFLEAFFDDTYAKNALGIDSRLLVLSVICFLKTPNFVGGKCYSNFCVTCFNLI